MSKLGYCIDLNEAEFGIRKENFPKIIEAIRELMGHPEKMGGATFTGGRCISRHFSFMDMDAMDEALGKEPAEAIEGIFDELRYPVEFDSEGNVCGIEFDGEKLGDEKEFFKAMAPYVEPESYIEIQGEEGAFWRWVFRSGKCITKYPTIEFDDDDIDEEEEDD